MASRSAHTFSAKSRLFEAALLVAGLNVVPLLTQPADAQGTITAPAAGVICDQAGPTCYDKQGPSIGLTQTYFGSIAANRYSVSKPRGGGYQLSDAKGNSWPVNVNDQGRSVSFTWSDRVLTVTPTAAPSNGNSFGQLLNNLMGQ